MYSDVFCKVYNEFGWNYYPEIFGTELLDWMRNHNVSPKTSMDLACGTGILCQILKKHGITASGMDISEGMIEIAHQNDSDIKYEVADMTTFCPAVQYDLVTCTGDAVNHILNICDVEKVFRNVYAYTSDNGYFFFDLLNRHEVSDSEPFEMDYDEHTRVWFQMVKPDADTVTLKIRVYEDEKLSFEENIHERIYDPNKIMDMLRNCGFREVSCRDSLRDDSANHGTTYFLIAQK